jgi:hypothetical protein
MLTAKNIRKKCEEDMGLMHLTDRSLLVCNICEKVLETKNGEKVGNDF